MVQSRGDYRREILSKDPRCQFASHVMIQKDVRLLALILITDVAGWSSSLLCEQQSS